MRMPRWFYAVVALILEAVATRRDRQIGFLKAQIEILRGKLPGTPCSNTRCRISSHWSMFLNTPGPP